MRLRKRRETVEREVMEPIPAEELAAAKKLQEAIDLLKVAKDDEARKVATGIIQDQLNSQFDRDVEQREKELVEVEQRVRTLREQLDKRKSLRDDIVGLRLKTIQNDAEGLGFPGEESTGRSVIDAGEYSPAVSPYERDNTNSPDDSMFDPLPPDRRRLDRNVFGPDYDDSRVRMRDARSWESLPVLSGEKMADDAYDSLSQFTQSLEGYPSLQEASAAFKEIRDQLTQIEANSPSLLSPSKDAQPIVEWARDRSKENGKLAGFALLRWYYGPERWTEILEAVRKLDPALANETDALLAPFQRPDIAPSENEPSNAWEAFEKIDSYNSLESVRDDPKQQADFLMRWASPYPASVARMNGIVLWLGRQPIATSDAILQRFRETNSDEFASEIQRYRNELEESAKNGFRSNALEDIPHSYTWEKRDVFSQQMPDREIRSLVRYLQSGPGGREKSQDFSSVFDEVIDGLTLRNWFDLSPEQAGQIVKWAKDRSKENGKLEGFALLRWYYPPARWTEILEAVRKLDPELANETDALLAPFLEPESEELKDNETSETFVNPKDS